MTRTPPDFPEPARRPRTLRMPPDSGTTSPASGVWAMYVANAPRSSSLAVQRPLLLEQDRLDHREHGATIRPWRIVVEGERCVGSMSSSQKGGSFIDLEILENGGFGRLALSVVHTHVEESTGFRLPTGRAHAAGAVSLCIEPAVSAQVRLLKHKPQRGFSCRAPGEGAGGCKSRSSRRSCGWRAAGPQNGGDARIGL